MVLKDAWVGNARPVRSINAQYIAPEEAGWSFDWLRFPPPATSELFERIFAFPSTHQKPVPIPDIDAETAIDLALKLWPIAWQDLDILLRMAALKYGAIDQRALAIRDELIEQVFRSSGNVAYIPVSKLPDPGGFGFHQEVEKKVESLVRGAKDKDHDILAPFLPK